MEKFLDKSKATGAGVFHRFEFGTGGSNLIRAMQKWLGVSADGNMGPGTIKALQKRMGTTQDGVISSPSDVVREMQKRLNANKL